MRTFLDHVGAQIAQLHARATTARFQRQLQDVNRAQENVLLELVHQLGQGEYGRRYGLQRLRGLRDFRRALPLASYEDLRPYIDRLADGQTQALFAPGQRIEMFARSSGTTAAPKLIPVTPEFVRTYRRGWNIFGLKMLLDHPTAILRAILQSTGRPDESFTPSGVPCGAITGLLARTQKRVVRRHYIGGIDVARVPDAQGRYYTLMRLGIVRDVAFAITASPATLIRLAQVADECSEALIRDVHDGTISARLVTDEGTRALLQRRLRPDPRRAAELSRLRAAAGQLRPRDYWSLVFLACWTGGSMGQYLNRLAEWYGPLPVRDIGLLASEGRVTIPVEDGTAAGILDVASAVFEFIPADSADAPTPQTLLPRELQAGRDYVVVLSNSAGLLRYRLNDVVRVRGFRGQAPVLEFLYRAGRVASVAGEKLTENQVITAFRKACEAVRIRECDFVLAPCWADPPYYRLSCSRSLPAEFLSVLDTELSAQNEEYRSRRKSDRLGPLRFRELAAGMIAAMDARQTAARRSTAEQYKRQCLFLRPGDDDEALIPRPNTPA